MRRLSTVAFLLACAVGMSRAHRGCISHNGWFYELNSDASITTLDRYQGATFVDRNSYAAFHLPAAGTTTWDEGVAFAATMQTRNVWLNSAQTSAASWVVNGGSTTWTFSTTVNGAPTQFSFTTAACTPATSPPPPPPTTTTAAPPPATPAAGQHRGCISYNGWFYDMRSDAATTTLDRYQGAAFVDRNSYAPFHLPAAGTQAWDEGVAFAATMQTRNVWLNSAQTTAAAWVVSPQGADTFTFWSTVNGAPVQFIFTTAACSPAPPPPATTTAAPATTTAAPATTTAAPSPALVGFHACISHNGWYYDVKGDSTFTQFDRFQGTTFVDRNSYAPFHLPAAGTSAWSEGVGFAATMQSRNVWLSGAQINAASWVQNAAGDTMTFSVAGAQFVFTTSNCV